jgi:NodT family efflux transporter outer membrane factor (OMF) lipoprotein
VSRASLFAGAALAVGLGLCGCAAVGPNYRPPAADVAPAFRALSAAPPAVASAAPWWTGFHDPGLDAVVERALAQNLDLAAASARVTQARAAARGAGAALAPIGAIQADAGRERQSLVGTNAQAAAYQRDVDLFEGGVGASWEIDLFGGLRRTAEAARADLGAAQAGLLGARLMVAAETADAYLQLRGYQARIALAERRIADDAKIVELVQLQFDAGHAPRLQLDQAQAVLAQAQAAAPLLRAGAEAQLNRLAVLTGRAPESERADLEAPRPVPTPPALPSGVTPGDLLRARPDVAAAERRLAAANARIGAAVADYYPKVSVQGLLELSSLTTGKLFSADALQGQGQVALRWRLFDFGRVDAEVAAAKGAQAEALATWRLSVLTACEDVENATALQTRRAEQLAALRKASAALERARDAAQAGYERGAVSFLDVIDAERQLLETEDAAADAETQRARAAVALRRALGG